MSETSDISVNISPGEGKVHNNQMSSRAGNCDCPGAGRAYSGKGKKLWAEKSKSKCFTVFLPGMRRHLSCVTTEIMAQFYLSV